jgi:hypothetical protein
MRGGMMSEDLWRSAVHLRTWRMPLAKSNFSKSFPKHGKWHEATWNDRKPPQSTVKANWNQMRSNDVIGKVKVIVGWPKDAWGILEVVDRSVSEALTLFSAAVAANRRHVQHALVRSHHITMSHHSSFVAVSWQIMHVHFAMAGMLNIWINYTWFGLAWRNSMNVPRLIGMSRSAKYLMSENAAPCGAICQRYQVASGPNWWASSASPLQDCNER